MVAAAGALVTKMVIAAFAGMGAATICHPLVSILEKMCILRFEELPSLNESSIFLLLLDQSPDGVFLGSRMSFVSRCKLRVPSTKAQSIAHRKSLRVKAL